MLHIELHGFNDKKRNELREKILDLLKKWPDREATIESFASEVINNKGDNEPFMQIFHHCFDRSSNSIVCELERLRNLDLDHFAIRIIVTTQYYCL